MPSRQEPRTGAAAAPLGGRAARGRIMDGEYTGIIRSGGRRFGHLANCTVAASGNIDMKKLSVHGVWPFRTGLRRVADGWALLCLSIVATLLAIFFLSFGMSAEMPTKRRCWTKHGADTSV